MTEHYELRRIISKEYPDEYRAVITQELKYEAARLLVDKIYTSGKRGNWIYTVEIVQEWGKVSPEFYRGDLDLPPWDDVVTLNVYIGRVETHNVVVPLLESFDYSAFSGMVKQKTLIEKIAGFFKRLPFVK